MHNVPVRSSLERAFHDEGEVVPGGSDRPLALEGDAVWLVEAGSLDVFAVPVGAGGAAGRRRHLFRVERGAAAFGPGPEGARASVALLGVGTGDTTLRRLSRARLDELAGDPALDTELAERVERWVETVGDGISRGVPPARCIELEPGKPIEVAEKVAVRPGSGVSWLQHSAGHSNLLGLDGLKVNGTGWVPVSHRSWLETAVPSRLTLVRTTDIPPRDRWVGLEQLHRITLGYAERLVRQQEAEERERVRRRGAADRTTMERACTLLSSTLEAEADGRHSPVRPAATPEAHPHAALLESCRMVAHRLGITLRAGGTLPQGGTMAALNAIARTSRFRFRRVALQEGWWQEDNGPLLAFRGEAQAPVALLPVRPGSYELHDPVDRSRTRVDAAVAESLAPFGLTLYQPFPERALRLWEVLSFGARGSRGDVTMLVLMGAMTGLLGLITPVATGMIFNTVIPGAERGQLLQLVLVMIVSAISSAMFQATRGIAQLRIEGRVGATIQAAVWDRLLSLPMSFFRPYSAGDLAVRAMGIDTIRQTLSGATSTALLGGLFSLTNFFLLFYYSWKLALWATLLVAIAVTVTLVVSAFQLRYQRQISLLQQEISGRVLQFLGSIAKLHVSGAEPRAFTVWAQKFSAQRQLQYRARRIGNTLTAFNAAFPVISSMVIFAAAVPLLQGDQVLRTGDFLAFMSSFTLFLSAMLGMTTAVVGVLAVIPLWENARPILETLPEVDEAKTDPGVLSGEIEATHLAFRYDANSPLVLRDLSFHIRAGEFVAFVGPSGTGKSTIFRLLLGFDRPESGAIYFDGQELGGLDAQAIRQQIGVVLQNGRLMPGDIFTNIVGSSPATLQDAWQAAQMAGFDEDIRQMPMGMHTVISEGGSTLSGGQRQRMMIARAIVNRPRILLFDEATSALDNRTQTIVSQSLERLHATRIVIAHRLSTIINADRIFVFEGGRIVESGNYQELMERKGRFAELAARQLM